MAHHTDIEQDLSPLPKDEHYHQAVKSVYRGMWLLAGVTLLEVLLSLFGKGHLGFNPEGSYILLGIIAIGLIAFSLYKAYYIIYHFMHMGHEVKTLRLTVLVPTILLVWAIIAFFQEGNAWKNNRDYVKERNTIQVEQKVTPSLKNTAIPVKAHDKGDAHHDHNDGHSEH